MNSVHVQQIWIAGFVLGVLYDYEEQPFTEEQKHIVIVCLGFIGIKIEWW